MSDDDSGIHVFALPPVPEEVVRQQWAMWQGTLHELAQVGGLTPAGLEYVRTTLRIGMWREDQIPDGFGEQRVMLLDAVCGALARLRPGLEAYYGGVGDMLPSAPVDASAILDGLSE